MTRHRFDPFSFLAGGVAVAAAVLVLVGDVTVRLVDLRVIGPVLVLALGLALLFGGRRDRDEVTPTPGAPRVDGDAPSATADPVVDEDDEPAWHELVDEEPRPSDQPTQHEPRTSTRRIEDEPRTSTQRIEPDEVVTERIEPDQDR